MLIYFFLSKIGKWREQSEGGEDGFLSGVELPGLLPDGCHLQDDDDDGVGGGGGGGGDDVDDGGGGVGVMTMTATMTMTIKG